MQLSYSWLNSFVKENQECTTDQNDFKIPTARLLHFESRSVDLAETTFSVKRKMICRGQEQNIFL